MAGNDPHDARYLAADALADARHRALPHDTAWRTIDQARHMVAAAACEAVRCDNLDRARRFAAADALLELRASRTATARRVAALIAGAAPIRSAEL